MNSGARRHQAVQYGHSHSQPAPYCPAQQAAAAAENGHDIEENIDPQLRSSSSSSSTRRPHLVPASFPNDEPYVPADLHQPSLRGYRPLRPRLNDPREWGEEGPPGASFRRRDPREERARQLDFNKDLYPGYDERGNRRGFDHLRGDPAPGDVDYYRPRTHDYSVPREDMPPSPDRLSQPQQSHHSAPNHPASGQVPYHTQYAPQTPHAVNPIILQQPHMGTMMPNGYPRVKTVHELLGLDPSMSISLDSLRDPEPGQKPEYTLPSLVKIAILSSTKQALSLQEIYEAIEKRFPWFASCDNSKSWKTSIRHSLSLIAVFQKVPRPITDPGKGHYWTVDFTKGEGNKRPRKRNRPPPKGKKAQAQAQATESNEDDLDELSGSEDSMYAPHNGAVPLGRTRDWRQSSHAASPNEKTAKPLRKAPYPAQTQINRLEMRHSMDGDDEFLSSEYSTPSNRESSLPPPPLQPINYNQVYNNNGLLAVPGHHNDSNKDMSAEYVRASGFAVPVPSSTNVFHSAPGANIAVDQANFGNSLYSGSSPTTRADAANDITNISRRFQGPGSIRTNDHDHNSNPYAQNNGEHLHHQSGFLTHSGGALPFGAGANPDQSVPHFGRPRDDVVLVNDGGLPSARRISRRDY